MHQQQVMMFRLFCSTILPASMLATVLLLSSCVKDIEADPQVAVEPISSTTQKTKKSHWYTGKAQWNSGVNGLPDDLRGNQKVSLRHGSRSAPYIAITYDDGPHPEHTPKLLDILKSRNVKATFYVLGPKVDQYPEIARRIVREGHEIGNHTMTHPDMSKMGVSGVRGELERCAQIIFQVTGVKPKTMRPPYGAFKNEQKQWAFSEFGYPTILWDVDPNDWRRPGSGVVANRLISGTRNGSILLAHDIHPGTIHAMPQTLDALINKGYSFVTISQLIEYSNTNGL